MTKLAEVMQVSKSGYYKWAKRKPSKQAIKRNKMKQVILEIFYDFKQRYGAPKIHKELLKLGFEISERTVGVYMKQLNIHSITVKKFKPKSSSKRQLPYENVLDQAFDVDKPNTVWVTDITYIWTSKDQWCYLASVMDLFNRKIIGYHVSKTMTTDIVKTALINAFKARGIPKNLIHHSDKGSQYTSNEYLELLKQYSITISLSNKGNCYDNACIESFHGILKRELIYLTHYYDIHELRKSIFEYIEGFYNSRRSHSTLDYLSPNEYEQAYFEKEDLIA